MDIQGNYALASELRSMNSTGAYTLLYTYNMVSNGFMGVRKGINLKPYTQIEATAPVQWERKYVYLCSNHA